MATKKNTRKNEELTPQQLEERNRVIREISGVVIAMVGIFVLVCILAPDSFGALGRNIHGLFEDSFGITAYLFPFMVLFAGLMLRFKKNMLSAPLFILSTLVFYFNSAFFVQLINKKGGFTGEFIARNLVDIIGVAGSYIFASGLTIITLIIMTGLSLKNLAEKSAPLMESATEKLKKLYSFLMIHDDSQEEPELLNVPNLLPPAEKFPPSAEEEEEPEETEPVEEKKYENEGEEIELIPGKARDTVEFKLDKNEPNLEVADENYKYKLPPLSLLNDVQKSQEEKSSRDYSDLLEETLADFGVDVKVINRVRGPTVTRYELQPAKGVKVKKVTNLSNDIALALAAYSIRIEAPIPGKSAIGIEIPNYSIDPILLKDTLMRGKYKKQPLLSLALGKDITGKSVMDVLLKMPHLLIAGATGSGKSVCINCIITSILFQCDPREVQLVMVDPKRVELSLFEGIPHLVDISLPDGKKIITDPKAATMALKTISEIMDQRYEDFVAFKVRNIKEYNAKAEVPIPYIVVIIDELADLMMVSSSTVEQYICRIAQLGRASGIHLILATQRPSVDVITGLIKANVPSRIAFAVSSQVDSRTILDRVGAEKLLGKGDMLYLPVDANEPRRIQGAYVSGTEVEKVVEFWKKQPRPENSIPIEIPEEEDKKGKAKVEGLEKKDILVPEAIEVIRTTQQASVSNLQRKMKIGYARAGRIMDQLEEMGIVGPPQGSKPRKILLPNTGVDSLGSPTPGV
ncbi:MAG: DNA translocase FtsK 4TM domain-containing protein [Vulcanimicrobiota bacterium]